MHPQRAVFVLPTRLRAGDRVPRGRGPWAIVTRVVPAKGRPPACGPCVVVETNRGEVKVPREVPIRARRVAVPLP